MNDDRSLTHIGSQGEAHMVDVGSKAASERVATAEGWIRMQSETLSAIEHGDAKKGDVIGTARIAGIMAAKQTSNLIPLCHPLLLSKVVVDIISEPELPGFRVEATVEVNGRTGVEMEALTAVSVACLTLYDMAKAIDRGMEIGPVRLVSKSGGRSGTWTRRIGEANDQ